MEQCVEGILRPAGAEYQCRNWRGMGDPWVRPVLGHLAEKIMGWENAAYNGSRLYGLVLERAVPFPKPATKYNVCCYSESGIPDPHLFCQQITFERGL